MNEAGELLLWLPDVMFDAYRAAPWWVLAGLMLWPLVMIGLAWRPKGRKPAAALLMPWLLLLVFQFDPKETLLGVEMIGLPWPWWG